VGLEPEAMLLGTMLPCNKKQALDIKSSGSSLTVVTHIESEHVALPPVSWCAHQSVLGKGANARAESGAG